MQERIRHHFRCILKDDDLPQDALERSRHFLYAGDLEQLFTLPLAESAVYQTGAVIMRASLAIRPSYHRNEPVPVLSEAARAQFCNLFDKGGAHADAALYVLVQDAKARAYNRALFEVA